jgi:hypothetical protein
MQSRCIIPGKPAPEQDTASIGKPADPMPPKQSRNWIQTRKDKQEHRQLMQPMLRKTTLAKPPVLMPRQLHRTIPGQDLVFE